ncbi:hypothetical protein CLU79DRAFT_146918 [Phycomyces nitens]|nr:hypothetical protein CLU79DRAFT_146918 [Phycomyces nitens]
MPCRFAKEMKDIVCDLKILLKLVCTREKQTILIKASEAALLKQIETAIKSIVLVHFLVENRSSSRQQS